MKSPTLLLYIVAAAIPGQSAPLGVAGEFSAFVLGNASQSHVDTTGRVAVGGNARFESYGVGSGLTVDPNRYDLVVGGDLWYHDGEVHNGSVSVGGTADVARVGLPHGSLTVGSTPPVDFVAAATYLTNASGYWGGWGNSTGAMVDTAQNQIRLAGSSNMNVFNLTLPNLISYFEITAPVGSTVLVNVDNAAASLQNFGFVLNGVDKQHVLFNFYNASTLYTSGVGVPGSILAPFASYNSGSGDVDGSLIVRDLTGHVEIHNVGFAGEFGSAVPEPSTWALLAGGLATVAVGKWRAKRP